MSSELVKIGKVDILALSDCIPTLDECLLFTERSKKDAERYGKRLPTGSAPRGKLNIGSYLLVSQGYRILVDTGLGPTPTEFFPDVQGKLLSEMQDRGIGPRDVDVVIATHMHFDHIGWHVTLSQGRIKPTFPNARYLIPKKDWDLFLRPQETAMAELAYTIEQEAPLVYSISKEIALNISQISNLELIDGEHAITTEISTVPTPGHTPGHISVMASSEGQRALIVGDAIQMPIQVHVPEWLVSADHQQERGRQTRVELVEWLEDQQVLVGAGHFPHPGFGHVARNNEGRFWKPLD